MKLKLKILFALLVGVAFIYTACKKTGSSPSGATFTPKQVTSQIALNLSETLFGGLGGVDVSGGLDAPSEFAVHTKGKIVNDLNNPFCGLVVDTTINETETEHDTTASISGHLNFAFTCSNDVLTGYTTNDNLNIGYTTSAFSFVYKIAENFTLLAINPTDDNSDLSLNGSLSSSATFNYKTSAGKSGTASFSYTFKSLVLSDSSGEGDITGGSATFTTTGTGESGVWSYSGTITFLGNHEATVTISGTTYKVNLETGVVS